MSRQGASELKWMLTVINCAKVSVLIAGVHNVSAMAADFSFKLTEFKANKVDLEAEGDAV